MVVEVTGDRKLENGLLIPGTFKAITRTRRLLAKFHQELTWIFPSAECKENQCNFKKYPYCYVIFSKRAAYVYRRTFITVICTFFKEGGGGVACGKGGA